MTFRLFTLVALTLLTFSCTWHDIPEEERDLCACGVADPATELPWLRELIREQKESPRPDLSEYSYIIQAEINGQTVFILENCCPFCNSMRIKYDCNGKQLGYVGATETLSRVKVVWRPENSRCVN